jgi:hypothetical protein
MYSDFISIPKINNDYIFIDSIISPIPTANERFGTSVVFGSNAMYVGAPGFNNGIGRVYKFKYTRQVNVKKFTK